MTQNNINKINKIKYLHCVTVKTLKHNIYSAYKVIKWDKLIAFYYEITCELNGITCDPNGMTSQLRVESVTSSHDITGGLDLGIARALGSSQLIQLFSSER